MRVLIILGYIASTVSAANWVAGTSALSYYLVSGGDSIWDGMIQKCQEFENNGGYVRGLNCIKNGVGYVVGAAASFGGGYVGAEFIKNYGRTDIGARSLSYEPPAWNWTAIEQQPMVLVDAVSSKLPGRYLDHAFNVTNHGMEGAVAVMNTHEQKMFAHVSNLTHGTVYMGTHTVESNLTRREGSWDFGGWGGIKFSYANPGCQGYSFNDADATNELLEEAWNFVNWANYGNKGATYSLQWDDEYRYGTPYVAGYLILEVNGFGTEYEGSPQLNDCLR